VLFGVLAVAVLPAAIAFSRFSEEFELLHAAGAIPVAALLALVALGLARRARRQLRFTLVRGRRAAAGVGRTLGVLALCFAITASISVGFYRLLVEFQ
jgi:multisubunit Na+/H+ antiporter MnhG subunit